MWVSFYSQHARVLGGKISGQELLLGLTGYENLRPSIIICKYTLNEETFTDRSHRGPARLQNFYISWT